MINVTQIRGGSTVYEKVEILLFEDNPGDACLIGEMLEEFVDFPYELINAETLNEGLSLLKEHPFNIIGLTQLHTLHATSTFFDFILGNILACLCTD